MTHYDGEYSKYSILVTSMYIYNKWNVMYDQWYY